MSKLELRHFVVCNQHTAKKGKTETVRGMLLTRSYYEQLLEESKGKDATISVELDEIATQEYYDKCDGLLDETEDKPKRGRKKKEDETEETQD